MVSTWALEARVSIAFNYWFSGMSRAPDVVWSGPVTSGVSVEGRYIGW